MTRYHGNSGRAKFLWRGYRLTEQWPGSCFLSIEPLLSRLSIKLLLRADQGHRIKQVIVGGESGKDARPMNVDWVRQLRDETKDAGRAFFFKQWSEHPSTVKRPVGSAPMAHVLDGQVWTESPWPVALPINTTRNQAAWKAYELWDAVEV